MKLLQIYNQYRTPFGGEETVVHRISNLVEKNGGQTRLFLRSSRGLDRTLWRKAVAALSCSYNPRLYREIIRLVAEDRPDVAHVHNLYPLLSPSVLVALRDARIPVVMTVHNHMHTCPTLYHLHGGGVCERCLGGHEYNCVLHNCRGKVLESVAYATRSAVARVFRLFIDNVTIVIALNEFMRSRLVGAGFDPDRTVVLPNMVDDPKAQSFPEGGRFAVYSGRISPEKGIDTLLQAAAMTPHIPVLIVGDGPSLAELKAVSPPNARFVGQKSTDEVNEAYCQGRFLVVPSRWFEGCPLVVSEAMIRGLPVIASRIGGLPELVEDGVTGLLFEPGEPADLAERMTVLWDDPGLCRKMGDSGRSKAQREYTEAAHWEGLQQVYRRAIQISDSLD